MTRIGSVRTEKGEKMPRLIDAVSLSEKIRQLARWGNSRKDILSLITNEPTVDAVPVIRCKECKKYIPCQKLPIGTSKWCDLFDRATCEMNYCSWGERREDADK